MANNIEKFIRSKMINTNSLSNELIGDCIYNPEDIIYSIIEILNKELPNEYKSNKNIEKLDCLYIELKKQISNAEDINKKIIRKKLDKLSSKISRILEERIKYIQEVDYEVPKLESFIDMIDEIIEELENKENKKVELLRMLIDEQQIEHLEYTFNKFPGFVNLRNKDEISLFRSIINRYLESAITLNEENILFYSNLLSLLKNQKSLNISNSEKKLCLDDITKTLNTLNYNKKQAKKHKKEIYWINNLITLIEPDLSIDRKKTKSKTTDMEHIAEKYDISTSFEEKDIKAIEDLNLPIKPEDYTDRRIVDDYIITIDGSDTIEIDDGISCKKLPNGNYLLGVHIASVLGYFDYNSDIVQEAINRAHTIYLPKNVIPLFPMPFGGEIASLLPNDNKLTRSYYFEIDKAGNIINKSFEKTIIKSSKKANYSEINRILEDGTIIEPLSQILKDLSELMKILEKKYQASLLYENIKRNKEDTTELKVDKIGAEKLVYYSMMIVGDEVAKFFAENNYPCLYRTLEIDSNTTKQLETMIKNVTNTYGGRVYDKLYQLISGIYPKAEYGNHGRHSGLDLDHYCHITSELRRAADIVVEHALETCYDKVPTQEELQELEEEIDRVSKIINNKNKKIEWFTNEYKTLIKSRRN